MKVKSLSRVRLLATPWTAAYQAPRSTGFFRQEYWEWVAIAFYRDLKQEGAGSRAGPGPPHGRGRGGRGAGWEAAPYWRRPRCIVINRAGFVVFSLLGWMPRL